MLWEVMVVLSTLMATAIISVVALDLISVVVLTLFFRYYHHHNGILVLPS